jgi:hypothetical protein
MNKVRKETKVTQKSVVIPLHKFLNYFDEVNSQSVSSHKFNNNSQFSLSCYEFFSYNFKQVGGKKKEKKINSKNL